MMQHNVTHWPLVITAVSGASSLADTQGFIDDWGCWLARGERFATLRLFTTSEALTPAPGSAPLFKQWLQRQGGAIRQQVMGMATVVPSSHYEQVRKMNAEKLFGVPATTFAAVPEALSWLNASIYIPSGLTFDLKAIAATVAAMENSP